MAFLRLFLASPHFAILDEATSALDVETERMLYTKLRSCCRSYLSVGHRQQLKEYHTHVLEFAGNGKWIKRSAKDSTERHSRERENLLS